MGRVDGKVVLITGAGRGMGRSHAVRLAEEGAHLALIDICAPIEPIEYPLSTEEDLAETVRLARAHGGRVVSRAVDVRDLDGMRAFVDEAAGELGGLDVAVANAGVIRTGPWDSYTALDWQTVIDVNLTGAWNTLQVAIPHLQARGGGSLIVISSVSGMKGTPLLLPYTVSKHGLTGLVLALANELADQSIRVNSVHPTGVPTGMQPPGLLELFEANPNHAAVFQNALPVEAVEPVDISNAVLYLASDESRYVTGLQLKVDAGVNIR